MSKFVLIGGTYQEEGKELSTSIEQEIVKLTGKENPTLVFLGFASNHSESDYDNLKKIYQALGCTTKHLKRKNLVNNPELIDEKVGSADIVYIGGGDTIQLLDTVKEYHLEPVLEDAIQRGCVMVGISAGAILLTKEGLSDAYIGRGEKEDYVYVKGLDYLDISICPHYHTSEKKDLDFLNDIKQNPREVFGLENNAALVIDGKKKYCIQNQKDAKVYSCTYQKKLIEKEI